MVLNFFFLSNETAKSLVNWHRRSVLDLRGDAPSPRKITPSPHKTTWRKRSLTTINDHPFLRLREKL